MRLTVNGWLYECGVMCLRLGTNRQSRQTAKSFTVPSRVDIQLSRRSRAHVEQPADRPASPPSLNHARCFFTEALARLVG